MSVNLGAGIFSFLICFVWLPAPAAAQEMIAAESIPCTTCHNATTMILSKQTQFHHSLHGKGEAYVRGTNKNCAGCHGSEGSEARIAARLMPHAEAIQGVLNVSPMNCRTCHKVHTSYTLKDFEIVGASAEVELEMTGTLFDGGAGNLCADCHQFRNALPVAVNGEIVVDTTRFGPHHGVEAQMMLGEGGLGLRSRPNVHYTKVGDTCVDCHMGPVIEKDPNDPLPVLARNHTFEAQEAYCTTCHEGIKDFDYQGVQTEIQAYLDEVKPLLISKGIMDAREGFENRSVEGTYPEEVANAMWNYMVVLEDGSKGVHHPDWAKELLEYARDALSQP